MTTFTLQDLTINNLPNISGVNDEMPMGEILPNRPQHAVPPQPTLDQIINTICTQLQLLATVIKQQPNTTPPEGNPPSLQETLSLTLQQADWFRDLVEEVIEERLDEYDFDDAVKGAVNNVIDDAVSDKLDNASISIRF